MGIVASVALALAATAAADAELGVRAEARASVVSSSSASAGSDGGRAALSAAPRAAVAVQGPSLRLSAGYGVQLASSDVGARTAPAVNQNAGVRLESRGESPLRLQASGAASRARLEPLAEAASVAATGGAQVASTAATTTESASAGVRGDLALERLSLGAGVSWALARGADGAARLLLPTQRGFAADTNASFAATERDAVGGSLSAARTDTAAPAGTETTSLATATGRWQHALSPRTSAALAAGVTVASREGAGAPSADPVAEAIVDHATARLKLQGWARLAVLLDRFDGTAEPTASAGVSVASSLTPSLSVVLAASGGARTDGSASFAALDGHVAWAIRPGLSLEAGLLGRAQQDRRADRLSFLEGGAYTAVAFGTAPLFSATPR